MPGQFWKLPRYGEPSAQNAGQYPTAAAPVYGLAVVAARQKNEAAAGTLLKQAVALDRSYAQRAVEDLEFQDYAQGKAFREALR